MFMNSQPNSSIIYHSQIQIPRPRRKKHVKIVHEMTQEELLADTCAWRKYGRKPIKDSPYPRNYYRCTASKGCTARKQVERSFTNPTIFNVSYVGEHTHSCPIHLNFLAGIGNCQNKFSPTQKPISDNPSPETSPEAAVTICKPSSSSSMNNEAIGIEEGDKETMGVENYDEILIPNMVMAEDILRGFEELRRGK